MEETRGESGKIKFWSKLRGYGFVNLDGGGEIFFFIAELLKAGFDSISSDTSVLIERGVAPDGRPMVARFLEIAGCAVVPQESEHVDGKWRRKILRVGQTGFLRCAQRLTVGNFTPERGYGFAKCVGGDVFFHAHQQGRVEDGEFVPYKTKENRNLPKKGDTIYMVLDDGNDSGSRKRASQWVHDLPSEFLTSRASKWSQSQLAEHLAEPLRTEVVPVVIQESVPEGKLTPIPAPSSEQVKISTLPPKPIPLRDQWVEVSLNRVRQERISYASSASLGSIQVPWTVLQKARIGNTKKNEKFEVRCEDGDGAPIALEIKRL